MSMKAMVMKFLKAKLSRSLAHVPLVKEECACEELVEAKHRIFEVEQRVDRVTQAWANTAHAGRQAQR